MNRVLFVTDSLGVGGAERQLTLLVGSLSAEWERQVWSLDRGPFAQIIEDQGIRVNIHERSWRWDVSPAFTLWRLVKTWRPQIIHSYGFMSTLAALPVSRALHIPLVDGTIRQANVPRRRGLIMKWSLKWADRVIANSTAGLKAFGIDSNRGRVVHNGFDFNRLESCVSSIRGDADVFTVIMVGRMQPEKDYGTYIKALQLLIGKERDWRFVALGDGTLRGSLLTGAADLVNAGTLVFPESTLEVMPFVVKAHVGVLMTTNHTHAEGISNAIMEYMACGLPVICSESGGNRELVVDGHTGFIIEPGNAAELAERLIWLRAHPGAARNMGLAGRRRIMKEFSTRGLVDGTLAIYQEVMAG